MNPNEPTVIVCDAAPPSLHPVNTYCVPVVPGCVVATEIVCVPVVRFNVCGAVCGAPPSTLNCLPVGIVCMVTPPGSAKFAITACGALIVTVVEELLGLATPPLQLVNEYPVLAVALIGTAVPEL